MKKKRSASFYIIIILALLAVGALVFLLAPGRQLSTPPVTFPSAPPTEAPVPVATEPAGSGTAVIAVTPATVQTVIATLHRIDSYSRTLDIRDFWSGGSRSRSVSVWCRGDRLRLHISGDGMVDQNLLLRDKEKWIWYSDSDAVFHGDELPGDADTWQTILTYENLLSAKAQDILDAGYMDFSGRNCIYVRWRTGPLGYVSECFIDPDTGLLMGERSYDGDQLVYSMDSSEPDVTTPDNSVFALPKGA